MGLFSKFKQVFKKEEKKQEDIEAFDKGLEKTRKEFVSELSILGHKYHKVNDDYFDELEAILIKADIGIRTVTDFLDRLRKRVKDEKIEDKVVKLDDNAIIANIHKCNYICPIPTYVNPEYIRQDEQNKILQSYNVCIDEYVVDKISSCINLLMAKNDPELINSDNKIYGHFFNSDAFYKDLARETSIYFSSSDISFQILDIALSYLKVPDKDKMEIAHGLQNWLVKESNHLCLSQDKKECLGKSLDQYMNSDKIMDQTQVEELMENLNYPKVEDLPITLPWINKDKDYEYQEERIKREDVVME